MTKDNMAEDSNGRARRHGVLWGEVEAAAKVYCCNVVLVVMKRISKY